MESNVRHMGLQKSFSVAKSLGINKTENAYYFKQHNTCHIGISCEMIWREIKSGEHLAKKHIAFLHKK